MRQMGLKDELKNLAGKYKVPEVDWKEFLSGKRYFLIDGGETQMKCFVWQKRIYRRIKRLCGKKLSLPSSGRYISKVKFVRYFGGCYLFGEGFTAGKYRTVIWNF